MRFGSKSNDYVSCLFTLCKKISSFPLKFLNMWQLLKVFYVSRQEWKLCKLLSNQKMKRRLTQKKRLA